MSLSIEEKTHLRDLAKNVYEISSHQINKENIKRWKNLNSLKKGRPVIQCTLQRAGWEEIMPDKELVITDPFFRRIERDLKRKIYKWHHFMDDEVITSIIYVPIIHKISDWMEGRVRPRSNNLRHSAAFTPCLNSFDDYNKLKYPQIISLDRKKSDEIYEKMSEIFGDILTIIQGQPFRAGSYGSVLGYGTSLMDVFCEMRGLEQVFIDLYENPEFVHEVMNFLMKGTLHILDELERENLLFPNNNETIIGPGGMGFTDELKSYDSHEKGVTAKCLWGSAQTQEFAQVSHEMLEEFVLPCQGKVLERFGLNYYGCCEPNDKKWGIIKKHIPNLRAASVSPWADIEIAAEELKDNYIYSWKPNPSLMICTFDKEYIQSEMKRCFEITRNCHVLVSLRDVQTLDGKPEKLSEWVRLSMDAAKKYGS